VEKWKEGMCLEMSMRASFYSKAAGSRIATQISDIKNCLKVEKLWENKQPCRKEVHYGCPWVVMPLEEREEQKSTEAVDTTVGPWWAEIDPQ